MQGKIIKGIAGFYYIDSDEKIYVCKAKGILRNRKIKPLTGDNVEFSVIDEGKSEGNIEDILERKNSLIRPAVANIDYIITVISAARPAPQLYMLDKYLVSVSDKDIPVVIVWNKADLDAETAEDCCRLYSSAGYQCFITSAASGDGIDELKGFLRGHTCALAGPSGVGKSSLTNILCPYASMETGSISRKIERGRHTTRHAEMFVVEKNTYICDTPGFTSVEFDNQTRDTLRLTFPEIAKYEGQCRFAGCRHMAEPDCSVKDAVASGCVSESRYTSYKKIFEEISSGRKYN